MEMRTKYRIKDFIWNGLRRFIRRCVCRRLTLCIFLVFLCTFSILTIYLTLLSYGKCSFIEVQNAVYTICDKYQNQEALGNLCADLCELNTLKPNSCLPNHLGKDVVFEATYFDNHVVLKSSKLNQDDFDQINYINDEGLKVHPSITDFFSMIANTVHSELNINITSLNSQSLEVLSKLWTRDMHDFPHLPVPMQNTALDNIWYLVQQKEYLIMKYYEDLNIFPRIIGTCGPFYAVEFIQPLNNFYSIFYPSWKEKFIERAKIALKLLAFLEETERHFPFLHYCDVKMVHFGFDKAGDIKLLDMDMVFFETALKRNMAMQNCSENQCTFIDCKGTCNITSQKCEPKVIDDNFQRVCANILGGRFVQSLFGVLSLPPSFISYELKDLLRSCMDTLDVKSSHVVANKLKHLLNIVVQDEVDLS